MCVSSNAVQRSTFFDCSHARLSIEHRVDQEAVCDANQSTMLYRHVYYYFFVFVHGVNNGAQANRDSREQCCVVSVQMRIDSIRFQLIIVIALVGVQ